MSTISNVNIVVQQGGGATEAQNVKHSSQEYSQVISAQQREKDDEQRITVQQLDQPEAAGLEKDASDGKRRRRRKKSKAKKKTMSSQNDRFQKAGKLVNTIA